MKLPYSHFYKESILTMLSEIIVEAHATIRCDLSDRNTMVSYLAEVQSLFSEAERGDFAPVSYQDYGNSDDIIDVNLLKERMNDGEFRISCLISDVQHEKKVNMRYLRRLMFRKKAYQDIRFRLEVLQSERWTD